MPSGQKWMNMMKKVTNELRKFVGMAYTTPMVRTAVQAALAVLVASGTGFVSVALWKTAAVAAGAAFLAKAQEKAR